MESTTLMTIKHCKLCTAFISNLHGVCGMVWCCSACVSSFLKTVGFIPVSVRTDVNKDKPGGMRRRKRLYSFANGHSSSNS